MVLNYKDTVLPERCWGSAENNFAELITKFLTPQ